MFRALVGLGSNLGDRRATLSAAIAALRQTPGIVVRLEGGEHETPPIGGPAGQPAFLNSAVVLETSFDPVSLLAELERIENALGRRREVHWGPRTIDLDLLLFDEQVLDTPRLVIPHPWLAVRRFVLAPAVEVAADWRHPRIGWTLERLLEHLDRAPNYLALCGPPGVGKSWLAQRLAAERGLAMASDPAAGLPAGEVSTGPAWATQLEFMACREQSLLVARQRQGQGQNWLVSDFWFAQGLAYAALYLTPVEFMRFEELWLAAAAGIDAPKLLMLVDPPRESLAKRPIGLSRSRPQMADWSQVREKLVELAERPGGGPVLHLRQSDPDLVLAQIKAALDAGT